MKITIVTLYRGRSAETYVGAVAGVLTDEEKRNIADLFEVEEADEDDEDDDEWDDDADTIGFAEVELADNIEALKSVTNAYPD